MYNLETVSASAFCLLVGVVVFVILLVVGPPRHSWCNRKQKHKWSQWRQAGSKQYQECLLCNYRRYDA